MLPSSEFGGGSGIVAMNNVVGDVEGQGLGGYHWVDTAGGREKRGIRDVQVLDFPSFTIGLCDGDLWWNTHSAAHNILDCKSGFLQI